PFLANSYPVTANLTLTPTLTTDLSIGLDTQGHLQTASVDVRLAGSLNGALDVRLSDIFWIQALSRAFRVTSIPGLLTSEVLGILGRILPLPGFKLSFDASGDLGLSAHVALSSQGVGPISYGPATFHVTASAPKAIMTWFGVDTELTALSFF